MFEWMENAVKENFSEVSVLKEGPRGSIRLLRHNGTGRRFILRRFTGNGEVYRKLLTCSCPGLPAVLEAAASGNENLVLEEYIEGDTLGFLLRDTLFSQQETRRIIGKVCRALWGLHAINAVHRDVKPENIILRGDEAVLIDFDAARIYKSGNDTDTVILGTTGFAAPEQYGLSQTDVRTDIYAVGILINVMLTGEHPTKCLAGGHLGRVVSRCTHVNPQKRYKDVLRLMEAL